MSESRACKKLFYHDSLHENFRCVNVYQMKGKEQKFGGKKMRINNILGPGLFISLALALLLGFAHALHSLTTQSRLTFHLKQRPVFLSQSNASYLSNFVHVVQAVTAAKCDYKSQGNTSLQFAGTNHKRSQVVSPTVSMTVYPDARHGEVVATTLEDNMPLSAVALEYVPTESTSFVRRRLLTHL